MSDFKSVLRSLRLSRGLTQEDLARSLRISRSTIGMYERGDRQPDYETLEAIADFFNVDIDYLLGRTNKTTFLPYSSPTRSALDAVEYRLTGRPEDSLVFDIDIEQRSDLIKRLLAYIEGFNKYGLERLVDSAELLDKIDEYKKDS